MPSDAPTAFFSYSRDDSDFALRLAGDLKAAGAHVWLDQLDIQPGERWARAVQDALNNSPRLLVILSPSSASSTHVEDEVNFALEEHKTVIPVLYRDCTVPFQLRSFQYADFRTDYACGLKVLLKTLGVKQQAAAEQKRLEEELCQAAAEKVRLEWEERERLPSVEKVRPEQRQCEHLAQERSRPAILGFPNISPASKAVLSDFQQLGSLALKGAVVAPLADIWLKVGPPPANAIGVLTALMEFVAVVCIFQFWTNTEKRKLRVRMLIALAIFLVGLVSSLVLLERFTVSPGQGRDRVVEGYSLRPDVKPIVNESYTPEQALRESEYNPDKVWTKESIAVLRTLITVTWMATFACFAVYLTVFIILQRRRHSAPVAQEPRH